MMAKISTQTINGKAFEYALLNEFLERLKTITLVSVVDNEPFKTAKKCFSSFEEKEQSHYKLVASFAVNFLLDI
jgi:HaeIII restriction endonuclease